jgi:hypothetical protein
VFPAWLFEVRVWAFLWSASHRGYSRVKVLQVGLTNVIDLRSQRRSMRETTRKPRCKDRGFLLRGSRLIRSVRAEIDYDAACIS